MFGLLNWRLCNENEGITKRAGNENEGMNPLVKPGDPPGLSMMLAGARGGYASEFDNPFGAFDLCP
jgi:hypothetical protein